MNIYDDQNSINENEDEAEVLCDQCNTVPDNYVKLECSHKYCLVCLAYIYLQVRII